MAVPDRCLSTNDVSHWRSGLCWSIAGGGSWNPRFQESFHSFQIFVLLNPHCKCGGLPSSSNFGKQCCEYAFWQIWVSVQQPVHSRISDFRHRKLAALKWHSVEFVWFCQKAGQEQFRRDWSSLVGPVNFDEINMSRPRSARTLHFDQVALV